MVHAGLSKLPAEWQKQRDMARIESRDEIGFKADFFAPLASLDRVDLLERYLT
jgi:hypothetical protein